MLAKFTYKCLLISRELPVFVVPNNNILTTSFGEAFGGLRMVEGERVCIGAREILDAAVALFLTNAGAVTGGEKREISGS